MNLEIDSVSDSNQELASSENVDVVISPFLRETSSVCSLCLSGSVGSLDELVDFMVLVQVVPQRLSVAWVVAASKGLLATVVEEGNTSGSEREEKSALEESQVALLMEESCVIVVVNEEAKCVNISECCV